MGNLPLLFLHSPHGLLSHFCCTLLLNARHRFLAVLPGQHSFRFKNDARVKAHHSAGRDHYSFARSGFRPGERAYSGLQLAKSFPLVEG